MEEAQPMDNSELEDGEISDDEVATYTPLSRPLVTSPASEVPVSSVVRSSVLPDDDISDTDEIQNSSDSDSSDANMKEKRSKPKVLRLRPESEKPKIKEKYNVWAATLQDDLMENMRGCDVTQSDMKRSRDVESYDYNIKYRLNNESTFKRKRQQSTSEETLDYNNDQSGDNKRFRGAFNIKSRNVKSRLGSRSDSSNSNSNDSSINASRQILDLAINLNSSNEEIAKDMANKLYEEKDDLLLRAINSIGKDIPLQIFSETQKIELDGGMMIMNRRRRRTPGGVFLFLLKKHNNLTDEQRKQIFTEDRKSTEKEKKRVLALKRDKKVEELKKTLAKDNDLPTLASRKEHMTHLMPETVSTLSNPPPSPVTDCNRENSCDFDDQTVHVNITSPEKSQYQANNEGDDDFLDVHGGDEMDLF